MADADLHLETGLQKVLALEAFPLLTALEEADLAWLAEIATPRRHAPGEDVAPDGLFVLLQGTLDDGSQDAQSLSAPAIVGASAVSSRERSGTRRAATPIVGLELARERLAEIVEARFTVWIGMLRAAARMASRVRADDDLHAVVPPPAPGRHGSLTARVRALADLLDAGEGPVRALAELARRARTVDLERGRFLWRAGDAADALFWLLDAELRVDAADGRRRDAVPGAFPGALAALAGVAREDDACVVRGGTALRLGLEDLFDVLEDEPELSFLGLCRLAERAGWLGRAAEERDEDGAPGAS